MNHSKHLVSAILTGVLLVSPLALYAKDIVGGDGTLPPKTTGVVQHTPEPQLNGADRGGHMGIMPIRGELSSSSNKEGRDVLRGGKIMASGTHPLPPKMERMMEERDKEHMTGSSTRDERREGMRERMGEHRGEVFRHSGDVLIKRMNAAVTRLTKLADRIDSRIAKIKASGTDTSTAEAKMTVARTKITEARVVVSEAEAIITSVASTIGNSSSTPTGDEKKSAKDALEKARLAIIAAQKSLTDVLPHILGNNDSEREHMNASSTHATGTPRVIPRSIKTKFGSTTTEHSEPN